LANKMVYKFIIYFISHYFFCQLCVSDSVTETSIGAKDLTVFMTTHGLARHMF
jgi:hypothetical protein